MAKRGRPRKAGARYPSGELKRPTTLAQIEEAERRKRLAETAPVMAQPHRLGPFCHQPQASRGTIPRGRSLRAHICSLGGCEGYTAPKAPPHGRRRSGAF
jgi:hypothetical protein